MLYVLISLILVNLEIMLVKVESKFINNAYVMRKWEKQTLMKIPFLFQIELLINLFIIYFVIADLFLLYPWFHRFYFYRFNPYLIVLV